MTDVCPKVVINEISSTMDKSQGKMTKPYEEALVQKVKDHRKSTRQGNLCLNEKRDS